MQAALNIGETDHRRNRRSMLVDVINDWSTARGVTEKGRNDGSADKYDAEERSYCENRFSRGHAEGRSAAERSA